MCAVRSKRALARRYVMDLFAPAARLVVEVDGGYRERQRGADARRDRVFARASYRVLRLQAGTVEADLERAVAPVPEALREGVRQLGRSGGFAPSGARADGSMKDRGRRLPSGEPLPAALPFVVDGRQRPKGSCALVTTGRLRSDTCGRASGARS